MVLSRRWKKFGRQCRHQTRKRKVASSDEAVEQEDGKDTSTRPLFEAGFSLRLASRSSNWSERSSIIVRGPSLKR